MNYLRNIKSLISILMGLSFLSFVSCNLKTSDKIDAEAVNQEIKARKIKRLTDAQIVQSAFERGKDIASHLIPVLEKDTAICQFSNFSLVPEVKQKFISKIEMVCETKSDFKEKEKQVWEAYQYNFKEGLAVEENIQKIDDKEILYSYPFFYPNDNGEDCLAMLRLLLSKREVIRNY